MKVWEVQGGFGLASLKPAERPTPRPGPGEVLIRMRAASLNYRDLLMVTGKYNPRQPLPLIPLSDGVGEVVERGERAERFSVGDRVAGIFAQGWLAGRPTKERLASTLGGPLPGVLCECRLFPEEGLVHLPAHLSDEEAACLVCTGVTAWSAFRHGPLLPGDTVLVQGTGGLSLFALQFAKQRGARVIVTSSSDDKLERVRALGADETINYRSEPEWGKRARVLTGGLGVDHVIEVGGAGTLAQSLRAVRPGGHISIIGALSGSDAQTSLLPILMQQVRVQGIFVGHRDSFEEMNRAVTQHGLRPVVDRVFPFSQCKEALEYLSTGSHVGKICLRA